MKILSKLKKGFVKYAEKRGNKMADKLTDKEIKIRYERLLDWSDTE